MKAKRNHGGAKLVRVHNPGQSALFLVERKNNMKKKVNRSRRAATNKGHKRRRRGNTGRSATVRTRTNSANLQSRPRTVNKGRRRHHHRKRNAGFIGSGLTPGKVISAGAGALLVRIVSNLIPFGAPGSWSEIIKELALAALIHKVTPKFLDKDAVTLGAVTPAVVSAADKLGVGTALSNLTSKLVPAPATAALPPAPAAQGLQGLVGRRAGMQGLVGRATGNPMTSTGYFGEAING